MKELKKLDGIEWVNTSSLKTYKGNPKTHTQEQIDKLAAIFDKYGFDVPIVVDEHNVIIKGHARFAAAKQLKWPQVPVLIRKDLTEQQVKASRIADNVVAESYWDMPALIAELEALYNLDDSNVAMIDTGFSDIELKSLLPGLMENEDVDYASSSGPLGGFSGFASRLRQDGKVGGPAPKIENLDVKELLNEFETVIIPVTGGCYDIAAVIEATLYREKYKVVMLYSHPGCMQFPETLPYLQKVSQALDVPLVELHPKTDEIYKGRIVTQGYPDVANLWCETGMVVPQIEEYLKDNGMCTEKTVMLLGSIGEDVKTFRRIGKFDQGYFYFCPFRGFTERKLHAYLQKNLPKGLGLHPLYCHLNLVACPGCPLYYPPDYAFMQRDEGAFPNWLKVLEYFGYSKRNRSYRFGGKFDAQLRTIIAENIDERNILTWADLAEERK